MADQRLLKCKLSRDEQAAYMVELTEKTLEQERVEQEKKESAAEFSRLLKLIDARRYELAQALETGSEYRHVECRGHLDGQEWVVIRADTGEMVESRKATPAELQTELFTP